MFTAKTYQFAQTVDEAYDLLNRHKTNAIVGGCGWLRLSRKRIWTAVDLTRLGLDQITQQGDLLSIGCMVTLRQLETNPLLQTAFGGILPKSVRRIVGVQFRNMATVGGSVYMRAGFSDLLCALLVLDTTVHLHAGGSMPLAEFMTTPYTRDILTHITIRLDGRTAAYESLRQTATDFAVLGVAVSRAGESWQVAVGGRPGKAMPAPEAAQMLAAGLPLTGQAFAGLPFSDNLRGSAEYRRMIAPVLATRAAQELKGEGRG